MTEPGDNLAGHNPSGHDPSGHHPTGGSGDDPGSRPSSDQNQPSTKTEDQPPRISVGKIALLIVLSVVLGAGLFVAGTYTWLERWANNAGPLGQEATVIIEPGTSFDGIAQALFYNQVIDRTQALKLWARLHGLGSDLKAGEYRFDPGASPRSVLARLQAGDVVVHRHIIPEGLTSHEIFDRLNDEPRLSGALGAVLPDGRLLPETYNFVRGDSRQSIVRRMEQAMDNTLATLWAQRVEGLPLNTPEEALILASIVEKETGLAAERAKVAGVFINRLNKGMRLQSDPTVIYALTEGKKPLGRALTRADWRVDHPYNTYTNHGLPPGAIANPGSAAIKAVLNPAEHNYIFFVADGSGGHAFSVTYDEHKRHIQRARAARRAAQGN